MQVILREDIQNLGKSGEVVTVKTGYGRNYLIPQGLAVLATEGNKNQIKHQQKLISARNARLSTEAQALANQIGSVEVKIARQVGVGDKLFGSVSSRDIELALGKLGIVIDRKKIELPDPLRTIGSHEISLKLGQGVLGKLKVVITSLDE